MECGSPAAAFPPASQSPYLRVALLTSCAQRAAAKPVIPNPRAHKKNRRGVRDLLLGVHTGLVADVNRAICGFKFQGNTPQAENRRHTENEKRRLAPQRVGKPAPQNKKAPTMSGRTFLRLISYYKTFYLSSKKQINSISDFNAISYQEAKLASLARLFPQPQNIPVNLIPTTT